MHTVLTGTGSVVQPQSLWLWRSDTAAQSCATAAEVYNAHEQCSELL